MRKWLAWRLVRLAHRLYDPEWKELISFQSPAGRTYEIHAMGDDYGRGIGMTIGIPWQSNGTEETAEIDGWKFTWHESQKI